MSRQLGQVGQDGLVPDKFDITPGEIHNNTLYALKLNSKNGQYVYPSVLNIFVRVCVKFGCKSASGYGHVGKTTLGSCLCYTMYCTFTFIIT